MRDRRLASLCAAVSWLMACGGSAEGPEDATNIELGETTLVVVVNPIVNDVSDESVPARGADRASVSVGLDDGPSGVADAEGVAVLAGVPPGERTLTLRTAGAEGSASVRIRDKELQEIALAADGARVEPIASSSFELGGQVVEITPDMSLSEVNGALAMSNTIVLLKGGEYVGDLVFAGSNVILFGEGARGGRVTIRGNVTVPGSGNGVRGAIITGDLSIPGSDVSVSFSSIRGRLEVPGSDLVLLASSVCGPSMFAGSGLVALGNAGLAPIGRSSTCP